jgi:DNA-binding MarR family transcriptional regulator
MTEDLVPTEVLDPLVVVSFTVMARLSEAAAAHDLSLTQLRALAILRDREPRMAELAGYLGLDKSTVTGLVNRAARRGLVERDVPAGGDRRAVRVRLTPDGQRLARLVTAEIAGLIAPMTGRLGPADSRRLGVLLARMLE